MSKIHLTTFIKAPSDRVFNLSRSLSLFKLIFRDRKEVFRSSCSKDLLTQGETLTISARHLGKTRETTLRVVSFEEPGLYTEEQVKGDLESFRHEHYFKDAENGTIMIDQASFGKPRDLIGSVAARFFLSPYLEAYIKRRADLIRDYAETDKWKLLLI